MLYCNFLHYYYLNSFSCVVVIVVICNNNFKPNSFLKHSEHLSYTAIKIYTKIFFFFNSYWTNIEDTLWSFSYLDFFRGGKGGKRKNKAKTLGVWKKNYFFSWKYLTQLCWLPSGLAPPNNRSMAAFTSP